MLHNFAKEHIPPQVLGTCGHALAMLLRCLFAMAQRAVAGSHCFGLYSLTDLISCWIHSGCRYIVGARTR